MDWVMENGETIMVMLPALGGVASIFTKNIVTAVLFGCMYIGNMILCVGLRLLRDNHDNT